MYLILLSRTGLVPIRWAPCTFRRISQEARAHDGVGRQHRWLDKWWWTPWLNQVSIKYFREDVLHKATAVDSAPLDEMMICWYSSSGLSEQKQQRSQRLHKGGGGGGAGVRLGICLISSCAVLQDITKDITWLRSEGSLWGKGELLQCTIAAEMQLCSSDARSIVSRLD